MAIRVSKNWSSQKLSLKAPWTAHDEYVVTGTSDEAAALVAVDSVDATIKIPQRNDGHIYNPTRLKCEGPYIVECQGPQAFIVGVDFSVPPTGSFNEEEGDPLLQKTRIRWEDVELSEVVDLDLDRRAIVYSNGEPVQGATRTIKIKRLSLIKNFVFWNPQWNALYENATNLQPVILTGGPSVAIQHMRLTTIIPAAEFSVGASYIPILASMEIVFDDALGDYPFQHRVMDQGTYGFSSNNKGVFVGADGQPVSNPIKLDGTGKPKNVDSNSYVKVHKADGTLEAPVASATPWTPASGNNWQGGTVGFKEDVTTATIGYFKKTRIVDINPFLNLFNN